MNGRDRCIRYRRRHPVLAAIGMTVTYLYALYFTVLGITLDQMSFAKQYMGIIFAAISVLSIILYFYHTKFEVTRVELFSYFFIAYVILNICITSAFHGEMSKVAADTFLVFGVKAVPAIFCALLLSKLCVVYDIISCVDYFVILATIGLGKVLVLGIAMGINRAGMLDQFGMDYQGISYFAAYMFLLNVYMIFVGHSYILSHVRNSQGFQVLRVLMAAIQFFVSLYSGGRGGFLLILVTIISIFAYMVIKEHNYKLFIGGILAIAVIWLICGKLISNSVLFGEGFERIFEFLGDEGINWEGTSGRKEIYDLALERISASPVFGYGITGGSYVGVSSCHNFFLEILVEGGVAYLCFWIALFVLFLKKLRKKIATERAYLLFAVIFLGDFINLMFSTIYLRATAMWFAIFYILNEKKVFCIEKEGRNA